MSKSNGYFFLLPNEVFLWGLTPSELSVYAYLRYCEDRKTHQCWPSFSTIAEAVHLSPKTVRKCVCALADKGLIFTENTTITTKDGRRLNGTLRYTIIPQQSVADARNQQLLGQIDLDTARWNLEKQAAAAK